MHSERLRRLSSDHPLDDVDECRRELEFIRAARGVLDAREITVLERLDELSAEHPSVYPDDEYRNATRSSMNAAHRVRRRANVCSEIPEIAASLNAGTTVGDRLDAIGRAASRLDGEERVRFAARGQELADAATTLHNSDFRRTLERILREVRVDDARSELDRQRRNTRLRWWNDDDGMWCVFGRFDPVNGALLEGRLRRQIERMFHSSAPETTPADPRERSQHLAALAFVQLAEGTTPGAVADVTVVIDERTLREGRPHESTIVDIGLGHFGLPIETIRRWACTGVVTPVIASTDGKRLLLGRTARTANEHQRRALRVLYRGCALCDEPFDLCKIHHVGWYGWDGPTDIDNLLPLCRHHHHMVHEGGWTLRLEKDRTLRVTSPDGATSAHDPPRVWRS